MDEDTFCHELFSKKDFGLMQDRHRIIISTALITINKFNGEFSNIIKAANNSAVKLL
jgi:hypothetical protein